MTREALLDGGPSDGKRIDLPTGSDYPQIIIQHDDVDHLYEPASGPVADEWLRMGTALYRWGGAL